MTSDSAERYIDTITDLLLELNGYARDRVNVWFTLDVFTRTSVRVIVRDNYNNEQWAYPGGGMDGCGEGTYTDFETAIHILKSLLLIKKLGVERPIPIEPAPDGEGVAA